MDAFVTGIPMGTTRTRPTDSRVAAYNRRMRKTTRPEVREGAGVQSPAPNLIFKRGNPI